MPRAWAAWAVGVTGLAACGPDPRPASAPAEVTIARAPPSAPIPPQTPRFSCVVRGEGEPLSSNVEDDYPLYLAQGDARPLAVVARRDRVAVAWSQLPRVGATGTAARARVDLAGHGARVTAWTPIDGHVFHVKRRAFVVPDRAWVRAGTSGRLLGVQDDAIALEVDTGLARPRTVVARTACADLVYDPYGPPGTPDDGAPGGRTVLLTGPSFDLFADPTARDPLLTIETGKNQTPYLAELDPGRARDASEAPGGRARVGGVASVLVFDAWIPADQIVAPPPHGRLGGSHRTKPPSRTYCPMRVQTRAARLVRPSPFWVRFDGAPAREVVGEAEQDAKVHVFDAEAGVAHFGFDSPIIAPAEGGKFFVSEADLAYEDPPPP